MNVFAGLEKQTWQTDAAGGGEGGRTESGAEIYTFLPFVKETALADGKVLGNTRAQQQPREGDGLRAGREVQQGGYMCAPVADSCMTETSATS